MSDYRKFITVAKDVKIQVEFKTQIIACYRLNGYENTVLDNKDFEDNTEDTDELGANQNSRARYDIRPPIEADLLNEKACSLDVRYKLPNSNTFTPMSLDVFDKDVTFSHASGFMKFTASIASFSMLLTDSNFKGSSSYTDVANWLSTANLSDNYDLKAALKTIVSNAPAL
jgi:Ca-activated chloride channel family protein